jgi:hypothetical protein
MALLVLDMVHGMQVVDVGHDVVEVGMVQSEAGEHTLRQLGYLRANRRAHSKTFNNVPSLIECSPVRTAGAHVP